MRVLLLLAASAGLRSACAAPVVAYSHDTDLPVVMVDGERHEYTRFVSTEKEPIAPVKYGQWFIPSGWAVALADRWMELPYAFDELGPEYCSALGVDKNRWLHASLVVRYREDAKAHRRCPELVWKDDVFMIGLSTAHSHSSLAFHGERISAKDAMLGSPLLARVDGREKFGRSHIAVHFFSGERLMGTDPATGKEAPVPAQSLLFTRFGGKTHVFMWTPLNREEEKGKSNSVRVYKPAADDTWQEVGECWAKTDELQQAALRDSVPPTYCDPPDFWLK